MDITNTPVSAGKKEDVERAVINNISYFIFLFQNNSNVATFLFPFHFNPLLGTLTFRNPSLYLQSRPKQTTRSKPRNDSQRRCEERISWHRR